MLSKILAGVLAVAVVVALWYRTEAVSAAADARQYQQQAEAAEIALQVAQRHAAAVEKVSLQRRKTEISRKEQANVVKAEDNQALAQHTDWASMPIPSAVLERLHK